MEKEVVVPETVMSKANRVTAIRIELHQCPPSLFFFATTRTNMITSVVPSEDNPDQVWLIYFKHKGATANIAWFQDDRTVAYLYDMMSLNRRKGEASELLQEIHTFCLEHGISLLIHAEVYEVGPDGIPDNEQLRMWYEKNGAIFMEYDAEGLPTLAMGALN
jgi:hypothetical protein